MTRVAVSVVLVMLLSGWTPPSDNILRFVESKESAEKAADVGQQAERDMYIGRTEVQKGNRIGALNRFKNDEISSVSARRGSLGAYYRNILGARHPVGSTDRGSGAGSQISEQPLVQ
jgi:hypothetical protein